MSARDRARLPSLQLIKRCPVSGAELTPGDDWGNLIYMSLCMDQGSGHTLQACLLGCCYSIKVPN